MSIYVEPVHAWMRLHWARPRNALGRSVCIDDRCRYRLVTSRTVGLPVIGRVISGEIDAVGRFMVALHGGEVRAR